MAVLLISNDDDLHDITREVLSKKYELIWCKDDNLNFNENILYDFVIVDFNNEKVKKGSFENIIKIKGSLGSNIPVLAILDGGSIQDVFEVLQIGAFDYVYKDKIIYDYKRKVDNMIQWKWYLTKYKKIPSDIAFQK